MKGIKLKINAKSFQRFTMHEFFSWGRLHLLEIVIIIFMVSNAYISNYNNKIFFSYLSLVILTLIMIIEKNKLIKTYHFVKDCSNDTSKISGIISSLAWFFFTLSLFFTNINKQIFSLYSLASFIALIFISFFLMIITLYINGNIIIRHSKAIILLLSPLFYLMSSTIASSLFLQATNLIITNSPLAELLCKTLSFIILFSIILQPLSYFIFIGLSKKAKWEQTITMLGLVGASTFLLVASTYWINNLTYYTLKIATNFEWRDEAICGDRKIKHDSEKYYGFNTKKYTVFFTNRNGTWGFEELECLSENENGHVVARLPISKYTVPRWFIVK